VTRHVLGDVCTRYHFGSGLGCANEYGGDDQTEGQGQPEKLRETVLLHVLPVVGCRQLVSKTAPQHPHEALRVRILRVQSCQSRTVGYPCVQSAQQTDVLPLFVHCSGPRRLVRPSVRKQSVSSVLNISQEMHQKKIFT